MPFEIAIVGAGIAGISLAVGLQNDPLVQRHCHVTVYEAIPEPRDAEGHAIICGSEYQIPIKMTGTATPGEISDDSPAWKSLQRANPCFHSYAMPPPWIIQDGQGTGKQPRKREPFEDRVLAVRRGLFVKSLREEWERGGGQVIWGKALDHITHQYTLSFADGTTVHADAVIGCDGVNSAVRSMVMAAHNAPNQALPTNGVMFRRMISKEAAHRIFGEYARADCQWAHMGDGIFFLTDYADGGETFQMIADFPFGGWPGGQGKIHWDKAEARKRLAAYGWIGERYCEAFGLNGSGEVEFDIEYGKAADGALLAWTRKTHAQPPPSFVHPTEAIMVIGDAAQTFQPYSGAGASEASADGAILSILIRLTLDGDLRASMRSAFHSFDAVRRARKAHMAAIGAERAHTMTGDSPLGLDPEKWKPILEAWANDYCKTPEEAQAKRAKDIKDWSDAIREGKRVADKWKSSHT